MYLVTGLLNVVVALSMRRGSAMDVRVFFLFFQGFLIRLLEV